MNTLKYAAKFLKGHEAEVIRTYIFHGPEAVEVRKSQIHKLYEAKQYGSKKAKKMLVQSTGWLSIIDKPTYYAMIQYIKFQLLEAIYKNNLENDCFGVQTDCIFYRVTPENQFVFKELTNANKWNIANKLSSIGTFKHERVNYEDVITHKARVVMKDGL